MRYIEKLISLTHSNERYLFLCRFSVAFCRPCMVPDKLRRYVFSTGIDMAYVIFSANQITCPRVTQLDANNTNPIASRHESACWWAALPSLVIPHGKPRDGKHQHHQVRKCRFISHCCDQTISWSSNREFSIKPRSLLLLRPNQASISSNQTRRRFRDQTKLGGRMHTQEIR
jgi:hypothetical protein